MSALRCRLVALLILLFLGGCATWQPQVPADEDRLETTRVDLNLTQLSRQIGESDSASGTVIGEACEPQFSCAVANEDVPPFLYRDPSGADVFLIGAFAVMLLILIGSVGVPF